MHARHACGLNMNHNRLRLHTLELVYRGDNAPGKLYHDPHVAAVAPQVRGPCALPPTHDDVTIGSLQGVYQFTRRP